MTDAGMSLRRNGWSTKTVSKLGCIDGTLSPLIQKRINVINLIRKYSRCAFVRRIDRGASRLVFLSTAYNHSAGC